MQVRRHCTDQLWEQRVDPDNSEHVVVQAAPVANRMKFEAAWGENAAGHVFQPSCFARLPRWAGLEDEAARGAVLANQSKVVPIDACP